MEKITKTMIREAIKNKEIGLLHKWAKLFGMDFSTFVNSQKCKRIYKANCFRELQLKRWRKRGEPLGGIYIGVTKLTNVEIRISAIHHLRNEIDSYKRGFVNHVKVPTYGRTQLYFCSPFYGHKDYNKYTCGLKIQGNEKFIEKLIDISKRAIKIKVYE